MNLLSTNRTQPSIADEYAKSDDFRELLLEGAVAPQMLAYLLTGNQAKAEQWVIG